MIRAIIVDDEFLARERVSKLLEPHDEIKVIGEAKNGSQAVELIEMKEPDLIFLDVQMPDFDGFQVVKRMKTKMQPYIVFTTAYDSYAIQAFDIHALDYLLKPIDEDRFNASIEKVLSHFQAQKTASFNKKLMRMIKDFDRPKNEFLDHVVIADKGWEHNVNFDEVLYFEANGNYLNLKTTTKTYLYRSTMNAISERINPEEFIRIHRSIIVNRRYIRKCTYMSNNEYEFKMKDGTSLQSGRSFKKEIMQYLS